MPNADFDSVKQHIINMGRRVVDVAMAREGAYAEHLGPFMVGGPIAKLAVLVHYYKSLMQSVKATSPKTQPSAEFNIDDIVILAVPDESLKCVRMLETFLEKIRSRWSDEERRFFSAMAEHYNDWSYIDGELIGPSDHEDATAPDPA